MLPFNWSTLLNSCAVPRAALQSTLTTSTPLCRCVPTSPTTRGIERQLYQWNASIRVLYHHCSCGLGTYFNCLHSSTETTRFIQLHPPALKVSLSYNSINVNFFEDPLNKSLNLCASFFAGLVPHPHPKTRHVLEFHHQNYPKMNMISFSMLQICKQYVYEEHPSHSS